jgi:acyl carrier protein
MMESLKLRIALLLEVDKVEESDELESFEWFDSLTILSIIALVDEELKVVLSADDIKSSGTIGGLLEVIKSRIIKN